ncbi:uncharacterized protein PHACADRAFT_32888 [Phanerochaete carnosa HHB-10118-sp]|uniref:Uncharacterized protein n=1 Tax=Phanerochaete carnosa (strain HHB-10118-sp) TaxID=650164 RepID=K5VFT5_PHACS|nr:uncharacterized protein PHACADRAFT_32888 [Phanerochaete carnosa HHB-10118-sp]EKM50038.1 hypothetical protein PHACADRAFT_32888 [Phanerochaete carnosa HHB-10118-sp]
MAGKPQTVPIECRLPSHPVSDRVYALPAAEAQNVATTEKTGCFLAGTPSHGVITHPSRLLLDRAHGLLTATARSISGYQAPSPDRASPSSLIKAGCRAAGNIGRLGRKKSVCVLSPVHRRSTHTRHRWHRAHPIRAGCASPAQPAASVAIGTSVSYKGAFYPRHDAQVHARGTGRRVLATAHITTYGAAQLPCAVAAADPEHAAKFFQTSGVLSQKKNAWKTATEQRRPRRVTLIVAHVDAVPWASSEEIQADGDCAQFASTTAQRRPGIRAHAAQHGKCRAEPGVRVIPVLLLASILNQQSDLI